MNSISELSLWIEIPVAVLLVVSSLFALCGALGMLRLKDFSSACTPCTGFNPWCMVCGTGFNSLLLGP